jgi:hypothetical protein
MQYVGYISLVPVGPQNPWIEKQKDFQLLKRR